MKKILMAVAVLALAGAVQAELLTWTSLSQPNTDGQIAAYAGHGGTDYDGYGWSGGVVLSGSAGTLLPVAAATGVGVNGGWYDGYGYAIAGFGFEANEADTVVFRLYDNADVSLATMFVESQPYALPTIPQRPVPTGAADLTFTFGPNAQWQTIPEPATIGLMGIAGMGLFLARRKVRS